MYTSLSWFLLLQSFLSKLLLDTTDRVFSQTEAFGALCWDCTVCTLRSCSCPSPRCFASPASKKRNAPVVKHCTRCFQVFPEMIFYRICRCTYTHVSTYYIDSLLSSQQSNNLITQSPPPKESPTVRFPGKLAEPSLESVGEHCCTGNLHFHDVHWSKCH